MDTNTSLEQVATLPQLRAWRTARTPQGEAYREFDAGAQRWIATTWAAFGERVAHWQAALAAQDLAPGARVAILLPNGLDAVCMDQAALALGCVPVPMHDLDNPGSIAYILADCEAACLIVNRPEQWAAIHGTGGTWPALARVVLRHGAPGDLPEAAREGRVRALANWLAEAGSTTVAASPGPEDLAAVVYTSGTTGKPKGVMLTHQNVVANVKATLERVPAGEGDRFLSFLPLSHTLERTAGYYLPMAAGACVAFARSVPQLAEDLRSQRPTVLISVPRIYERVYVKLQQTLGTGLRHRLFEWAQAVGWRRFRRAQGLALSGDDARASAALDALAWPLLERLVARPLQAQFGGRLRVAVTGGAPLSAAIGRCFLGLGLPLVQGYGLTETTPVAAANAVDDNDPQTVGRPLRGLEIRIGDNAEVQVRGASVMRGYWKRPEDTARVLSPEGWFSTGDQGARQRPPAHPRPPQGNHRHLHRRKGFAGRPGTGPPGRRPVRPGLCGGRGAALHRRFCGAGPRGLAGPGGPVRLGPGRGQPGPAGGARDPAQAGARRHPRFPALRPATRPARRPGALDLGEHPADAHAQAQAQQPHGPFPGRDRGDLPTLRRPGRRARTLS
jgi:long-chain acyl-CoA synthetase